MNLEDMDVNNRVVLHTDQQPESKDMLAEVARRTNLEGIVNLHANLDDKDIERVIQRYKGTRVTFQIEESDSTFAERMTFRARWIAAGGPEIG